MDPDKKRVMVKPDLSIKETMKAIDEGCLGIALVVDHRERLQGTVTDGDIRRAILKGSHLDEPISKIMNPNPTTVSPKTDSQTIRQIFIKSTLKHLPVNCFLHLKKYGC